MKKQVAKVYIQNVQKRKYTQQVNTLLKYKLLYFTQLKLNQFNCSKQSLSFLNLNFYGYCLYFYK